MGRKNQVLFITISIFILLAILFYPEVHTQYECVFEKNNNEFEEGYMWYYGEYTHFVPEKGVMGPYVYGIGHNSGDICRVETYSNKWRMNILRAPGKLGDAFIDGAYMTDSLIYVVGANGYAYSADMEYMRIINVYNFNKLTGRSEEIGDYHILWGNRTGYIYLLMNNTIFYLYQDMKILKMQHYNFTGYYFSSYPWNGGFVIRFEDSRDTTRIYYLKNWSVQWELTTRFRVRCYQNFVYAFDNSHVWIYRNGEKLMKLMFNDDVVDVNRIGNLTYVASYSLSKNYLMIYDPNFKILKTLILCDMGTTHYKISNQKMGIFKNDSGYTIFLYTSSYYGPFIPLRINHLDNHLNIVDSKVVRKSRSFGIVYPLGKIYVGTGIEWSFLYLFHVEYKTHVNFFAWMPYKILAVFIITLLLFHIYFSWRNVKKFKEKIQKKW